MHARVKTSIAVIKIYLIFLALSIREENASKHAQVYRTIVLVSSWMGFVYENDFIFICLPGPAWHII